MGVVRLTELPHEVRWGAAAVSKRLPTPPSTGMIQVNVDNGNTRVVRVDPHKAVTQERSGAVRRIQLGEANLGPEPPRRKSQDWL